MDVEAEVLTATLEDFAVEHGRPPRSMRELENWEIRRAMVRMADLVDDIAAQLKRIGFRLDEYGVIVRNN